MASSCRCRHGQDADQVVPDGAATLWSPPVCLPSAPLVPHCFTTSPWTTPEPRVAVPSPGRRRPRDDAPPEQGTTAGPSPHSAAQALVLIPTPQTPSSSLPCRYTDGAPPVDCLCPGLPVSPPRHDHPDPHHRHVPHHPGLIPCREIPVDSCASELHRRRGGRRLPSLPPDTAPATSPCSPVPLTSPSPINGAPAPFDHHTTIPSL